MREGVTQAPLPEQGKRGFMDRLRNRRPSSTTVPTPTLNTATTFKDIIDQNITTEIQEPPHTPLSAETALAIPYGVEKAWENDPDYESTLAKQQQNAKELAELFASGKINQEQFVKILAALFTEGKLASQYDDLTEILRRGPLDSSIQAQIDTARRTNTKLVVALGDIDRFKRINDTLGHLGGDAVLQSLAGHISNGVRRKTDIVGRYGGEEIVVAYPNATEEWARERLSTLMQEMSPAVAEAITEMGFDLEDPVTMSIGIVEYSPDPTDKRSAQEILQELYKIADARMYLGKNNGRNQIVGSQEEQGILDKIESDPDASEGPTH